MTDIPLPDSVIAAGAGAYLAHTDDTEITPLGEKMVSRIFLAMAKALVEHDRNNTVQWVGAGHESILDQIRRVDDAVSRAFAYGDN